MDLTLVYISLVESLQLLASSYEDQLEFLGDSLDIQDEAICGFWHVFQLLPELIEEAHLSSQGTASIIRCFNFMDMAIHDESLSDLASYKNHEVWQTVRVLAGKALADMDEPNELV